MVTDQEAASNFGMNSSLWHFLVSAGLEAVVWIWMILHLNGSWDGPAEPKPAADRKTPPK